MKSVPPRGSGWVRQLYLSALEPSFAPTRYREVVLTPSRRRLPTALLLEKIAAAVGRFCIASRVNK